MASLPEANFKFHVYHEKEHSFCCPEFIKEQNTSMDVIVHVAENYYEMFHSMIMADVLVIGDSMLSRLAALINVRALALIGPSFISSDSRNINWGGSCKGLHIKGHAGDLRRGDCNIPWEAAVAKLAKALNATARKPLTAVDCSYTSTF